MLYRKPLQNMTPYRAAPVMFQMGQPVRGLYNGKTGADGSIGDRHPIPSGAIPDFLVHGLFIYHGDNDFAGNNSWPEPGTTCKRGFPFYRNARPFSRLIHVTFKVANDMM